MALRKYQSVEIEYGITPPAGRGIEDAWEYCGELIAAYVGSESGNASETEWGMEGEMVAPERYLPIDDDSMSTRPRRVANMVLKNGGRYYVDHAHPEYSAPELSNALDVVIWEKAGDRILETSMAALRAAGGGDVLIYKNNSDGKHSSYACHENYLVDRRTPFYELARKLIPFFVTRQIYAGAGKVGSENGALAADYQMSQRADFIETGIGVNTTFNRAIVNTRDEPHADPERYRRLHVIVGDSNMSETSIYLRNGMTAIVLSMIEDGYVDEDFRLADPVAAIKQVSRDLTCQQPIELADGSTISPIELQAEYLAMAQKYSEIVGVDDVSADVLKRLEGVLTKLERDPMSLAYELDWVAKLNLLLQYQDRRGWSWAGPNMRQIDLKYHDIRQDKGLYYLLERREKIGRMVTDSMIDHAVDYPPEDTRAYIRGESMRRFAGSVAVASWEYMTFDLGDSGPFQRLSLPGPHAGTKTQIGVLLERSANAAEFLRSLAAA